MLVAVDFDGTCVTHDYPNIGKDIGAVPVLKKIVESGHNLILLTMRHGKYLDEAVKWFEDNGIDLYAINENPQQKEWTESPKVYANIYIDDAGLGIPLLYDNELSLRPFVNWMEIEKYFEYHNLF
jgi:hydroxymethylpyrimidine pyrophosphatase-like HAD family hydrolase